MDNYKQNMMQNYESLNGLPIGMCYVPWQHFQQVLDADSGLHKGTIFAELILPFYGEKAACNMNGGVNCHERNCR